MHGQEAQLSQRERATLRVIVGRVLVLISIPLKLYVRTISEIFSVKEWSDLGAIR